MKMKDIKLKVKRMSDEKLIQDASKQYVLANNDSNVGALGVGLLFTGTILIPTIIAPLILYPIGILLIIISPRKNNKIKNIMFKELKRRGYKIIIKGGFGINNCGVSFIKNKY